MIHFYLTHFKPNVVFQMEKVKLQIKTDFYEECYTGLKWVKGEYPLTQTLNLVSQNLSKEVFINRIQNSSKNSKSL